MATWRVTVVATDNATAKEFKEARENFKAIVNESGNKLVFEFSESNEKGADELADRAKALGFKAEKERYEDPLDSAGTTADFW